VLTQTRRHSYIAHLLGIRHLVVAVNKMDLVDYDPTVFEGIRADYLAFTRQLGIGDVEFIPLSALNGDMLVERGERLDWYRGPTLLEILEAAPAAHTEADERFRFPVQYVCRPHQSANPELHDFRGFMGRVESGQVGIGDEVVVLPAGRRTRIKGIRLGSDNLQQALAGQSVTLLLQDEIDISRGDMVVRADEAPAEPVTQLTAMLCWLSESPLDPRRKYLIRHTTRETRAMLERIEHRVDINTLERVTADALAMNDIAKVSFRLALPLAVDTYATNRATGAFIVIDESSNGTVAAGVIV
jgi:sulfate adenylyltransferase subunit 1